MRPLMTRDVCNDIYGTKVVHQKSTTQYQMIIKNCWLLIGWISLYGICLWNKFLSKIFTWIYCLCSFQTLNKIQTILIVNLLLISLNCIPHTLKDIDIAISLMQNSHFDWDNWGTSGWSDAMIWTKSANISCDFLTIHVIRYVIVR